MLQRLPALPPRRLWRFVLYWWWFVGLSFLFGVGVGTTVLPLPAGWVVRKQLARALRQEGAVLAATVRLLTEGGQAVQGSRAEAELTAAEAQGGTAAAGVANEGEQRRGSDVEGCPPEALHDGASAACQGGLAGALRRLWCRSRRTRLRHISSLGAGLSRIPLAVRRGSRSDLAATAAALGVQPELYPAVEPIYALSGPASASLQASGGWDAACGGRRAPLWLPLHAVALLFQGATKRQTRGPGVWLA
jgi:hypothetical protein